MDTPEPRTTATLHPPPRRRRRPRRYLSHLSLPPDLPPDPVALAAPFPLLHRVLSGLRALPDAPPTPPGAPAAPSAGWKCTVYGCLWESINPMSHPCPFPPSAAADAARPGIAAPAPAPGAATLADLTRRLLARDPSLGAPPEEREPSPDVVVTQELPVITADGGAR